MNTTEVKQKEICSCGYHADSCPCTKPDKVFYVKELIFDVEECLKLNELNNKEKLN